MTDHNSEFGFDHDGSMNDFADAIRSGEIDMAPTDDEAAETLRKFVEAAERGDLTDPVTPSVEAAVREAQAMLEQYEDQTSE